ncbi:MAG TPA: DUF2007 domain-containing protein [Tepidisphaeraceae bacterium]|nr:DUF2007 domain-containing protein [Tepidisphaeraceae bacterium]
MKQLYQARDSMEAHFLRNLLEAEGITAQVMDEALTHTAGMLVGAVYPTVWIDQADWPRASEILDQFKRQGPHHAPTPTWKCKNCGEIIEGQFTECWKCRTPRPDSDDPSESIMGEPIDPTLQADLPCVKCGYNLRGLTPANRCPECGLPILRSLLDALRHGMFGNADEVDRVAYQPFESASRSLGFPADALLLICRAWMQSMQPIDPRPADIETDPGLCAERICTAVRDLAIDDFGSAAEAKSVFKGWGIQNSGDIGRIVEALASAQLIQLEQPQVVAHLNNLCSLNDMFP